MMTTIIERLRNAERQGNSMVLVPADVAALVAEIDRLLLDAKLSKMALKIWLPVREPKPAKSTEDTPNARL